MEVLTCILKEKADYSDFHFHWKCSKNKIINLCFADDLMIFCKGERSSIKHIHDSFLEFKVLSGLSPSPGKSSVFFSGVDHSTREDILLLLGFKEGTLPVKYLGVPLLTTKLKHGDCKNMIDKITARTKTWTNRDLTYAGRVQLIKKMCYSPCKPIGLHCSFYLKRLLRRLKLFSDHSYGLVQILKNLVLKSPGNTYVLPSRKGVWDSIPSKFGTKLQWQSIFGSLFQEASSLCGVCG
jgi:hypothetical protein